MALSVPFGHRLVSLLNCCIPVICMFKDNNSDLRVKFVEALEKGIMRFLCALYVLVDKLKVRFLNSVKAF